MNELTPDEVRNFRIESAFNLIVHCCGHDHDLTFHN